MQEGNQRNLQGLKEWKNPEIWNLSISNTEMEWRGEGVDNCWLELIEIITHGKLEFGNKS